MSADVYLKSLLDKYTVDVAGVQAVGQALYPILQKWGNGYLNKAEFSGSLAKGTGISIGTDADIFLSLSSSTTGTLADVYQTLYIAVTNAGLPVRKQNVSIGIKVSGYSIDLVPGKRQSQYGDDHSLYQSKTDSWLQTNVNKHIAYVQNSGRIDEIRVLKLWRQRHGLSFSSFFLEMAVIDSLRYARQGNLAENVTTALEHIRDNIVQVSYIDPANTNNCVSDDCSFIEKLIIAAKAQESLTQKSWGQIVW